VYKAYRSYVALFVVAALGVTALGQFAAAEPVPDENGVMMYRYGGSVGTVYNPKVVALEGMHYYREYETTGDPQARQNFLSTADWLVGHATDKGNYTLWEYGLTWPHYDGFDAPYSSALAQAEGLVVLTRAHNLTGSGHYLAAAKKAFGAFMADYEAGGVATSEGPDSAFLQILAKPGAQRPYVLNGHTGSLIYIWWYYEYTHDYRALVVFGKGINWLLHNLEKYDTGDWSYYDLQGHVARENYHRGQTAQLGMLYEITGEPVLKEYGDRFAAYAAKEGL
jgi:heparosan-N-sulfate-glucuronate 5-epimerase